MKLELRLAVDEDWEALAQADVLPRFLRALEAGRAAKTWQTELVDSASHFGWYARGERPDRVHFITLESEREGRPSERKWTLSVASGPAAQGPPAVRGGEWLLGAVLAFALYHFFGGGALLALALFFTCGLLVPKMLRRKKYDAMAEPDEIDRELLERVRRGAEQFAAFTLVSDWEQAV